jgi:hypothetical protein
MGRTEGRLKVDSKFGHGNIDINTSAYIRDSDTDYRIMRNVADALSVSADNIAYGHSRTYSNRMRR